MAVFVGKKYRIEKVQKEHYARLVEVYNSNRGFLEHHLGVTFVDEGFILREALTMQEAGFVSCVAVDLFRQEVEGLIEFRPGEEVYLSLLMLDRKICGRGEGRELYELFEEGVVKGGCNCVRIDVVDDYEDNVTGFWREMGFAAEEHIDLSWGEKKSRALVMRKTLRRDKR